MKSFIYFREFRYFFIKNWYCINRTKLRKYGLYKNYIFITDLGAITFGIRKDNNENRLCRTKTREV